MCFNKHFFFSIFRKMRFKFCIDEEMLVHKVFSRFDGNDLKEMISFPIFQVDIYGKLRVLTCHCFDSSLFCFLFH